MGKLLLSEISETRYINLSIVLSCDMGWPRAVDRTWEVVGIVDQSGNAGRDYQCLFLDADMNGAKRNTRSFW